MKGKRSLIFALALICALCICFAFGCSDAKTYYTVTFMDGQTQVGQSVQVEKGRRIAEYPAPERSDPNYVFDGWFKDEELTKIWNKDTERVTKDVTLWAGFLYVPATPSNVAMGDGAFSNTVTWLQRGINENSAFKVKITGTDIVSAGSEEFSFESYKGHDDIFTVGWTPAQKPAGGVYSVEIYFGDDGVTADGLMFKGAGVADNPYLITSQTDLAEINSKNVAQGNYYKAAQSFTARLSATEVADKMFNGVLDGNGKTITLEASDCGLFGVLGGNARVYDLTVAGAVNNIQTDCVGVIAGVNRGEISYCTVTAGLESTVGTVGALNGGKDGIDGGAAGVAGINYGDILCCTYSGAAKVSVGGAGIAVINNGTVSLCSFTGTIGAANSVETGSSTKAYSYIGGIVALNYGSVEKSSTDGSGKLLAQRGEDGKNDNVGGIVAVNAAGATVTECWFDGIRVHGNRNVGGIAGVNAGTVSYCYAGADYHSSPKTHSYVGGLSEVGGIVGLSDGGTVSNCFVTANVYAYSGNAYKVAQSAVNCVYLGGNLDEREGTSTLTADDNNGNIRIEISGDYAAKSYRLALTDEQLATLNGDGSAFTDKTAVRLACEDESTVIEHLISVTVNGEAAGTVSDVTGNKISLAQFSPEAPDGSYFAGWAVTQDGEVVFGETAEIGYSSLERYGAERVVLYPVFVEGEKPQSPVLSVAAWTRYVQEETVKALLAAFQSSVYFKDGYEVKYTALSSSNNANFKTDYESGDYNVVFAYSASAVGEWQATVIEVYIYSVYDGAYKTLKVGLNSPDAVVTDFGEFLGSDEAKKIMNPAYVTEDEADKVEITLMNGGTQYGEKLTASNATDAAKITLPSPEAEAGKQFAGWAVAAEQQEGETLLTGEISYSDVEELATDGSLTLYARYKEETATIIKIAVFKRYITEEQYAVDLVSAFCSEYGYDAGQVQLDFLGDSKSSVADFSALVNGGNYDIVLCGGNNIGNSGNVEGIIEKKSIDVKGQTGRYIAILTQTQYAQEFYAFVDTTAGKTALNPDYTQGE